MASDIARASDPGELYLGLDVGGTKCAAVVGNAHGDILQRRQWPTRVERGVEATLGDLARHAVELCGDHPDIRAVGVAIGGPVDTARGIVDAPPNLPGWNQVPLRRRLELALGLPVHVEHDAAACCFAEFLWGAGQNATRLIYLTCGTGFGAGMVFDGTIYRGAGGRNVELGHARYRDDGPTAFGKQGSIEAFCAGGALGRLAHWLDPQRFPDPPATEVLAELAKAGDQAALSVLAAHARATGDVCAWLGDFLRPDLILLGSLARHLGPAWVSQVIARFRDEALPQTIDGCRVAPAGLGERLQDCSALAVALRPAKQK